jgi:hypothetical protein
VDRWKDGRKNREMNGWIDEVNGLVGGRMDTWMYGRTHVFMHVCMCACMAGWLDGWMDGCTEG